MRLPSGLNAALTTACSSEARAGDIFQFMNDRHRNRRSGLATPDHYPSSNEPLRLVCRFAAAWAHNQPSPAAATVVLQ
jgi:hypothetical protein